MYNDSVEEKIILPHLQLDENTQGPLGSRQHYCKITVSKILVSKLVLFHYHLFWILLLGRSFHSV